MGGENGPWETKTQKNICWETDTKTYKLYRDFLSLVQFCPKIVNSGRFSTRRRFTSILPGFSKSKPQIRHQNSKSKIGLEIWTTESRPLKMDEQRSTCKNCFIKLRGVQLFVVGPPILRADLGKFLFR